MTEQSHSDQDPQTYTAAAEYAALADTPPVPGGEHAENVGVPLQPELIHDLLEHASLPADPLQNIA